MQIKYVTLHTTKVSAESTAGEIVNVLIEAGASGVQLMASEKRVSGIQFVLEMPAQGRMVFKVPVKVEPMVKALKLSRKRGTKRSKEKLHDQAERTAWRLALQWIKTQLAMVSAEQADICEVFMPYLMNAEGKTLYQHAVESGQMGFLPAPKEED